MSATPDPAFLSPQYVVEHVLSFLGMLVTFGLGYWTARRMQDREVKERQRGIALALLEEIERIRSEIGPILEDVELSSAFAAGAMVPDVHPWVHGIIADAARTNPDIVGAFMRVDRYLFNLRFQRGVYERALTHAGDARHRLKGVEAESSKTPSRMPEDIANFLSGELEARQNLTNAEGNLRRQQTLLEVVHRELHAELNRLQALLTTAIHKHLPGAQATSIRRPQGDGPLALGPD